MSNPGALSSTSGGSGVQLQADIGGLTQWLVSLGIAGFKQHALAGVDTHTILSMLSIAEVCPLSMQCRSRLSQRRNEQRRQSIWLYKVVEIGAGTNYIVDQLLQTRPGENIMGMMSSLAPILPKNAFNTVVLSVFQKSNAPLHNVPGLTQLEKFRETILPLASAMGIKDKVFQYHKWMVQQLEAHQTTPGQAANLSNISPTIAIPDPETIASAICYLSKLVEEQELVLVLVHHGLLGAAWIAAYAQDVLGLPVCVFVNEKLAVPLSGDEISARVIIRLYSKKQTCELRRVGNVEDFIKVQSSAAKEETGWIVDTRITKYFSSEQSTAIGSRGHIYTTLARSLTIDYVHTLARSLNRRGRGSSRSGLKRFAVARFSQLKHRAVEIMQMLGFDCTAEIARRSGWRNFFASATHQQLAASRLWTDTFGNALLDLSPVYSSESNAIDFTAEGQDAIDFLFKAVNFAATLAFTNWGRNFCGMSVHYLNSGWKESWMSEDSRPLPYRDPQSLEWRDPILEMFLNDTLTAFDTTDLLRYAIYISTDTVEDSKIRRYLDPANGLIATSCEGLVIARTMSMPDAGATQSIELLSFYPGAIISEGENLTSIKSETSGLEVSAELVTRIDEAFPSNAVQDLRITSRSLIENHEVLVETQVMIGNECYQLADAIAISEAIPQLLVADKCAHDYNEPYLIPQRIQSTDKRGEIVYLAAPSWQGGLSFQAKHRSAAMRAQPTSMKIYVQHVDGNPQGQWVACQWTSDWDPSALILQEDSCLGCIFERVRQLSLIEVGIINGRSGTKSSPKPKSKLAAPSHHRGRSSSAHSHQSSTSGLRPEEVLREQSSVSQNIQRTQNEEPVKPPSSFEAMGVPVAKEVSKKSRTGFTWSKQKDPH